MTIVRVAGFKWLIEDEGAFGDVLGPWHETELESTLLNLLPVGGVFLDIGAHVGHETLRAAMKASTVIAVEANPATFHVLQENLRINHIGNVYIHEIAAWDCWTTLMLDSPHLNAHDGSTRVASLAPDAEDIRERVGVQVRAAPLDEVLEYLEELDLVKMDIEGADLHALRGMRGIIERTRPVMFIEDHSIYGYYKRAELESMLTELRYRWDNVGTTHLIAEPR